MPFDSDQESNQFQLQRVQISLEFEQEWTSGRRADFKRFLLQVDKSRRAELLTVLLDIDCDRRKQAEEMVSAEDYRFLGDSAVSFVEKLLERDN